MSIKPEDDFSGYMESLKAHEMQDQAYQNQLAEHEVRWYDIRSMRLT
jgi:hypothetical protein